MDLWNLALAAIFFCAMGTFAAVAALYLTQTPVRLFAHQAAEIVLFCLFAIALFAVIATLLQTTREITPKRPERHSVSTSAMSPEPFKDIWSEQRRSCAGQG